MKSSAMNKSKNYKNGIYIIHNQRTGKKYSIVARSICKECPGKDKCEYSDENIEVGKGFIPIRVECKAENWDKWHKKEEEKTEALENAMLSLGHDLDRMAWDISCE